MLQSGESLVHPWESTEEFIASTKALHEDLPQGAFPPLDALGHVPTPEGATLRFVFWRHVKANQAEAIPLLEGCDILAFEAVHAQVFEDIHSRQRQTRFARDFYDVVSALVSGTCDPKTAARLKRANISIDDQVTMTQSQRKQRLKTLLSDTKDEIFPHFIDRVEKVVNLDIGYKDAKYHASLEAKKTSSNEKLINAITNTGADWQTLSDLSLESLSATNDTYEFREKIAARQLEKLAANNPGKTIGVLYGNTHQVLTRLVHMEGTGIQRVFVKDKKADVTYEYGSRLRMSMLNMMRSGAYDPELMDRHLTNELITYLGSEKDLKTINTMKPERYNELVENVKALWSTPILVSDPNPGERVADRRKATLNLIKASRRGAGLRVLKLARTHRK